MVEKVNAFPMEELYYLESQDFLVDRESVYLKKNKTMKLNSYWLGCSKLRVNNDKLLYLFNGLRGYYDVRSRYIKDPKIFEKRVPFSKKILVNEYFVNKFKYSDMLLFSLNYLNRPTITIKKEEGDMHYWFPSRLVEYINFKREVLNAVENNKQFYKDIRQIKDIGFRFYLNPRRRNKYSLRRAKLLPSIALGFQETFFSEYNLFLHRTVKILKKTRKFIHNRLKKKRRRYFMRKFRFPFFRRKFMRRKKLFHKVSKSIRLLLITVSRFLNGKSDRYRLRKKTIFKKIKRYKKIIRTKKSGQFLMKSKNKKPYSLARLRIIKTNFLVKRKRKKLTTMQSIKQKNVFYKIWRKKNKRGIKRASKMISQRYNKKKFIHKTKHYKKIKNEIFQKKFRSII